MFLYRKVIPGLAINSYIVGDEKAAVCAVIDPIRDVSEYIKVADAAGMQITDILETHVHSDFVSGAVELKHRLKGKPQIHCSGMGGKECTPHYADHVVADGDEIRLGSLYLRALHTPGHTPEHVTWKLYDETKGKEPRILFTGDCLFVGEVGRPDLLGQEASKMLAKKLYHTVFDLLTTLPDQTEVFPAHGAGSVCGKAIGTLPSSTIGREKQTNPSLKKLPEEEWISQLMSKLPHPPAYFKKVRELNKNGPTSSSEVLSRCRPLPLSEVQRQLEKGAVVLDVRSKELFASSHIPGCINIPLSPNLAAWAGWVLPPDRPIILLLEFPAQVAEVLTQLSIIGYDDQILGYLDSGMSNWIKDRLPTESIKTISAEGLKEVLNQPAVLVLDVRTPAEWQKYHINNAQHIPLNELSERIAEIPKGLHVHAICGSGYRSSIAASVLKRSGFQRVTNVFGGMSAWVE